MAATFYKPTSCIGVSCAAESRRFRHQLRLRQVHGIPSPTVRLARALGASAVTHSRGWCASGGTNPAGGIAGVVAAWFAYYWRRQIMLEEEHIKTFAGGYTVAPRKH